MLACSCFFRALFSPLSPTLPPFYRYVHCTCVLVCVRVCTCRCVIVWVVWSCLEVEVVVSCVALPMPNGNGALLILLESIAITWSSCLSRVLFLVGGRH